MRVRFSSMFKLSCLGLIAFSDAQTLSSYQLSYDGISSSTSKSVNDKYASTPLRSRDDLSLKSATNASTLISSIAEDIASKFTSDFHFLRVACDSNNRVVEEEQNENVVKCVPKMYYNEDTVPDHRVMGTKCFTTYNSASFSFIIDSSVYPIPVSDALSGTKDDSKDGIVFGISIDATVNAPPLSNFARDMLVQFLPKIKELTGVTETSKNNEVSRTHLMSYPDDMYTKCLSSTEMSTEGEPSVDVWEYEIPGQKDTTLSLFIESQLRVTTDPSAIAHAESFVHPSLLAHVQPEKVAVISDAPLMMLREIWKHKTIEQIDVIGANLKALEAAKKHIPGVNDCSSINPKLQDCLNDFVTIVNGSAFEWAMAKNSSKHEDYPYDVILLDIASEKQADDYLSEAFQKTLFKLVDDEDSIIVVNIGSIPSIRVDHARFDEYPKRTSYLDFISNFDLIEGIHIYDEPLATPLETSFIIFFMDREQQHYHRYVRKEPAAIDLDLSKRLYKQKSLPTTFYDGPTHVNQLKPSRAWENWYCNSHYSNGRSDCEFLSTFYNDDLHKGATVVKRDAVKGRGLFAANDIEKGQFINADDLHLSIHIDKYQWVALNKFVKDYPDAHQYRQLKEFFESYGFENESLGDSGWSVSLANTNTFTNHACSKNVTTAHAVNLHLDSKNREITFSPLMFRRSKYGMATVAARDVEVGEEILMDYSPFRSNFNDDFVNFLQTVCNTGEGLVPVEV